VSYRSTWGSEPAGQRLLPRPHLSVHLLIYFTVAVYLVQFVCFVFRMNLATCLGVRADLVVERLWVWQIVTYMFLHSITPEHILFNMLALYWFGGEYESVFGRRRFLTLYFGGGVLGGLAYCVTQYLVGSRVPAVGASAAVMAVMVAYACHFPNRIVLFFFLIPTTIKLIVVILVAIDLLYSIGTYGDGVAHTAHLGGALFGLLYWRFCPRVAAFFDRMEDRHREHDAQRLAADERRMDELLDKISREGFDSLKPAEREFLKRQSQRRRDRGFRA
jgi:membrane associated rhomboid family serine protease